MSEDRIDITIDGEAFTLRGVVGEHVEVAWRMPAVAHPPREYHHPLETAVAIGAISDATALEIADKLAVDAGEDFKRQLQGAIDGLKQIWQLDNNALNGATFKVTELGVNTRTNIYTFGFGVVLPSNTLDLPACGVTLESFGMTFTYHKTAP